MGFGARVTEFIVPELEPCALAIITAKYGRKIAPANASHINQPSTKMAATMQITRIVMAIRYLTMRVLRSASADSPTVVMLWALSKVTFESYFMAHYKAKTRLHLVKVSSCEGYSLNEKELEDYE
jgi:hypothetical protein